MMLLVLLALSAGALSAPTGQVEAVANKLDSPIQDIRWITPKVVIVLTRSGTVHLSSDGGRSWLSQHAKTGQVKNMFISSADNNFIFLLGNERHSWTSSDMGKSWTEVSHPEPMFDIQLHPSRPNYVLGAFMAEKCTSASAKGKCYKSLYYSLDSGTTWNHGVDYIVQWAWSPPVGAANKDGSRASDTVIYATVRTNKKGDQIFGAWDKNVDFVATSDFFKNIKILVPRGNRFTIGDFSYLFVAAVDQYNDEEVHLYIARDNKTYNNMPFLEAVVPVELHQHSYTIVDSSEAAVFLHVNHRPFGDQAPSGHIYLSDWRGLTYSLSLQHNVRSASGECDFHKIRGIQGVYIANFLEEGTYDGDTTDIRSSTRVAKPSLNKNKVKTVITFDKGGEWKLLDPPEFDSNGKKIACSSCHLHLNGITSDRGYVYSLDNAPGLIISTGSVGKYLDQTDAATNTYLSRDAGLSWKEIQKGAYIYELGDNGGLIVLASQMNQTSEILYSWDQGTTFQRVNLRTQPFSVDNIIIEPTAAAYEFIVMGHSGSDGVVVYVDFQDLHQRECEGHDAADSPNSDYETWTPSDGRIGSKCLLGSKISYVRRKADSQCFNPQGVELPVSAEFCPCTAEDFECDYGYSRLVGNDECVVTPAENFKHPSPSVYAETCAHGSYERITKGYRRVPGDVCTHGEKWDAYMKPCAASGLSWLSLLMYTVLVGCMIFCCFFVASKFDLHLSDSLLIFDFCKGLLGKIPIIGGIFSGNAGYDRLRKGMRRPVTAADVREDESSFDIQSGPSGGGAVSNNNGPKATQG